jgi:membrane protein DedA with SNARE-associated domain
LFGFIPHLSFRHYIIATVLANLLPCFIFSSIGSTLKFFPFEMNNIHKIMWNVGITLLLISGAIILKLWFHDKKQPINDFNGAEANNYE